jgi:hypothetical protein
VKLTVVRFAEVDLDKDEEEGDLDYFMDVLDIFDSKANTTMQDGVRGQKRRGEERRCREQKGWLGGGIYLIGWFKNWQGGA